MKNKKKDKHNKKFDFKRFFIVLLFFFFIIFSIYKVLNTNIKNIYIKGNKFYSDQKIIDISGLKNYPRSLSKLSYSIKSKLEKDEYILSANVYKSGIISQVYIMVKENYPMFYYQAESKTILYNGDKVEDTFAIPTLINQVPNTIYKEFLERMRDINLEILSRMSEIEYKPNDVDNERFLILMNDGNYVYLTLNKFLTVTNYLNILKSFDNKKGILYLDSGEYFHVFDE